MIVVFGNILFLHFLTISKKNARGEHKELIEKFKDIGWRNTEEEWDKFETEVESQVIKLVSSGWIAVGRGFSVCNDGNCYGTLPSIALVLEATEKTLSQFNYGYEGEIHIIAAVELCINGMIVVNTGDKSISQNLSIEILCEIAKCVKNNHFAMWK